MSTEDMGSLATRLEGLESRIRDLESVDEIRNLKAEYAAACDDSYDPDRIAALFIEDATWESQGLGLFEGREAIREFFRGISSHFVFALHYGLNPSIEVTGDTARARWYLFMPAPSTRAIRRCGGPASTMRIRSGRRQVDVQEQEVSPYLQHHLRTGLGQAALRLGMVCRG